jgi:hypothetical protein
MGPFSTETIRLTLESYTKAIAEIAAICDDKFEPSCNEYNMSVAAPKEVRPTSVTHRGRLMRHAQGVIVGGYDRNALFDFGRPRQVEPGHRVWRSSFFKVSFWLRRQFGLYRWECGRMASYGDDGEIITPGVPAHIDCRDDQFITLRWSGKSWGLRDWKKKADEIRTYCDVCCDEVRDEYAKRYREACDEVSRWEDAISKVAIKIEE